MRTALLRLVVTTAILCGCGSGSASDPTAGSKAGAIVGSSSEEERAAREIDALVAAGRIGEAHTQARLFVQSHPDSPFAAHVTALMGVHPHREGPPRGSVEAVKP
jgi:hypothetical protein